MHLVGFTIEKSRAVMCFHNSLGSQLTRWLFIRACSCIVRSQWPRGLRRGRAAARFLRWRFRISPGHGYLSFVSVLCCQVEVSATGRSLFQRRPTECGVCECDLETSKLVSLDDLSRRAATGCSPAEIVGSNPTGGMDICLL